MRRLALCFVGLLLVAPVGCRGTESSTKRPSSLEITQADDGKTLDVKSGQSVRVTLRGNPSTGYQWVLTKETSATPGLNVGVTQVGETRFTQDSEQPGSPGTVVMIFKIGRSTALSLDYSRPWEKNVPPTKSFKVNLVRK